MNEKNKLALTWVALIAICAVVLFPFVKTAWVLREAKQAVSHDFIDPSSATFRDLRVGKRGICGQVNAKNRMGAYVGYETFFFDRETRKAEMFVEQHRDDEDPMAPWKNYQAMEAWYERVFKLCSDD